MKHIGNIVLDDMPFEPHFVRGIVMIKIFFSAEKNYDTKLFKFHKVIIYASLNTTSITFIHFNCGKCMCSQWVTGFPLGLKNLEKWEGIFQSGKSQGILNRLEKSGKITQNTGKLKEFEINVIWYFNDI